MSLTVNGGTPVTMNFPSTGVWETWANATQTVDLVAGANTIRLTSTTATGGPNLDYLDLGQAQTTSRHEAEAGVCQGTVDFDHAGFSGTGFCNVTNAVGSFVEFTVTAAAAGTATISVHYANGTTANRPMGLSVNGGAPVTVNFPSTGVWETWANATATVSLTAGANTIRLTSTTATGGPNLDYLDA
jgi:hypothetical protein